MVEHQPALDALDTHDCNPDCSCSFDEYHYSSCCCSVCDFEALQDELWADEEIKLVCEAQHGLREDLDSADVSLCREFVAYLPEHPASDLEAVYDLDFAGTDAHVIICRFTLPRTWKQNLICTLRRIPLCTNICGPHLTRQKSRRIIWRLWHSTLRTGWVPSTSLRREDEEGPHHHFMMSSPSANPKKRTIASFFSQPQPKRAKVSPPPLPRPAGSAKPEVVTKSIEAHEEHSLTRNEIKDEDDAEETANQATPEYASQQEPPPTHPSYPHPVAPLPPLLTSLLNLAPSNPGRVINNRLDLELLYYTPYIPPSLQKPLFKFLRSELPFYRVKYNIKRGPTETQINTPRYTTVWGIDATSYFSSDGRILDANTHAPVPAGTYKCTPRPIPACLAALKNSAEAATGETFNFVLVNYYADGKDSISYHSDDEAFLGPEPCIASFSLGSPRDFLLRHKDATLPKEERDLKLKLEGGDCVLMWGKTQSRWLHSIPKRSDKGLKGDRFGGGRINVTLRKAVVKAGTGNYYRYNVGDGEVYCWSDAEKKMIVWEG